MTIDEMLEVGRDELEGIFKSFGIEADVNKNSLCNAIAGVPGVSEAVASRFDGTDDYDNATGKKKPKKTAEEKAVRNEKIKGKALGFLNVVKGLKDSIKGNGTQPSAPEPANDEPSTKKILGVEPWIFWSVSAVIFLIIVFLIVRAVK